MTDFISGLHKLQGVGALLILFVSFYLFTLWMIRRLARLSRIKYFQVRGLVGANEFVDEIKRPILVGFFHPYCNAGGGGERVLWASIRAIQKQYNPDQVRILVYTGDVDFSPEEILGHATSKFGISLEYDIDFLYLKKRSWLEAKRYPHATLLLQSLASVAVGMEAFSLAVPDVFIDTMGYAFIFPFFKYMGCCKIAAYVHYPTISSDMLNAVEQSLESVNNSAIYTRNKVLRILKSHYYNYFAELYGLVGRRADVVIANSTWTSDHIKHVWDTENVKVIFPPCDISAFVDFSLESRKNIVASVAQFRPEKDHSLQLFAFAKFLKSCRHPDDVKLILIGGCRNDEDQDRVIKLKQLAKDLEIEDHIGFHINCCFQKLKSILSQAKVGIHTMHNEHFGIGVVEYQASGCIALAHNSGGPKMDICIDFNGKPTGFLADSVDSYASMLERIFSLSESERIAIAFNARQRAKEFSEEHYEKQFMNYIDHLLVDKKSK